MDIIRVLRNLRITSKQHSLYMNVVCAYNVDVYLHLSSANTSKFEIYTIKAHLTIKIYLLKTFAELL